MLIKNSLIFAGTTIVKGLCAFLVIAAFTRLLSPAEYGQYIVLISIVIFVDAFAFQSVRHCVIRHITSDRRESDGAYMGNVMLAYGGFGLVSLVVPPVLAAVGLMPFVGQGMVFSLLGLLIVLEAFSNLAIDLGRVRNNYTVYVVVSIAKPLLSLGVGVALILAGWSVFGAVLGMVFGAGLALLFGLIRTHDIRLNPFARFDAKVMGEMFAFGGPLAVTFFIQSGIVLGNRFMLEGLASSEAVGLFAAAQDVPTKLLTLLVMGVHIAAYPLAVKAMEDGGPEACRGQLTQNILLLFGLALPACVGMSVLAPQLAYIFVGEAFRPFTLLYMPVFAALALVSVFIQYYLLLAFNLAKQNEKLIIPFALSLAVMLIAGFVLIPLYDVLGAVYASVASLLFLLVAVFVRGRGVFRLPFPMVDMGKMVVASAVMAGTLLALGARQAIESQDAFALIHFIFMIGIGAACYFVALYLLNAANLRGLVLKWLQRRNDPARL